LIKNKLKTAVIGLGVGAHHAKALASHPGCELVWICDFDKSKFKKLNLNFNKVKNTANAKDILTDPNIDMVSICTYDETHFNLVVEALKNNKHVYVEKPMCLSKSEAKKIRYILKNKPNLRLSSNMVLRSCPLFINVRKKFNQKASGEVYYLEADYFWGRKKKLVSGWRAKSKFYSIIHGAAIHMIDLAIWILGKNPVSVQALGNNITTKGSKQKHNDFSVILLYFKDKSIIKVSAHGGCTHPHFHSLKVFGKNLSFIHDISATGWIQSTNENQAIIPELSEYPAKTRRSKVLVSFINSLINENEDPLVTDEEVFNTTSICLAAEQSVKTGKIINIEYL
tara:strand:- start:30197 stop:31213 length:1017 start_codon:yes stop_codon:yes gene_type:complete